MMVPLLLALMFTAAGSPAAASAGGEQTITATTNAAAAAHAAPPRSWRQDAFFISFWVGPQVAEAELDDRFAEIVEANFTGYLGFNGEADVKLNPFRPNASRVAREIELCDKYGLKCVPSLCGARLGSADSPCAGLGKRSPNFWGWQLLDEPGGATTKEFSAMGRWQAQLAAARPSALSFFNLLGDTPFASLGEYAEYIGDFTARVHPQLVSMDFYPRFPETAPPRAGAG
eukprot:SAG11_NODE_840_length_6909_cov_27.081057_3_plen_230_part_00